MTGGVVLTFWAYPENIEAMDRLISAHGCASRSELLRRLVTNADKKRARKAYRESNPDRDIPGQLRLVDLVA